MSSGHGSGGHGQRPRRKKAEHHEEHENHERWAVSYADMMTVLVGLFIVLYSMSQVDQAKFEALRESLAAGFGHRAPSMLQGSTGALSGVEDFQIVPDLAGETGIETEQVQTPEVEITEEERTMQLAAAEYDRLAQIRDQISQALNAQGLGDRVRFRVTERGLVIGMVADDVFFSPDTATLTETALRVLDTTAPVLVGLPDQVSIEGHANVLPSSRYPTNWELSSDRATQVLRRMVEVGGLPAGRVAAVGFGEARPIDDPGVDPLEANRRVDLVVLSGISEDARVLLPSIENAHQG
ncbi:OmpA/MotB family protein [Actinotalea subterranea]|uniref:OmpA/MotB family protein n=1 Tax=Actinotalea subterranea TaxID=2607497 RepID=UPI0011F0129B|nr:flagellar motor protein MotB [Actinotalea subterranea]